MLGSTRCPRCAKHLPSDAAFCRRCGRDLRAPHGLAGMYPPAPALPRRPVPPPPVLARNRHGIGRFAIVAFAFFALLFITGMLFSTRTTVRPRITPAPPTIERQSEWGHDHSDSTDSSHQRQDSRKPRW